MVAGKVVGKVVMAEVTEVDREEDTVVMEATEEGLKVVMVVAINSHGMTKVIISIPHQEVHRRLNNRGPIVILRRPSLLLRGWIHMAT
jgi:hypothetical protein